MSILEIKDLCVNVEKKEILKKINLKAKTNDVVAIIGPNGSGKSSLFKAIMHHFAYKISSGSIFYNHQNLQKLSTNKIVNLGFYYVGQDPVELEEIKLIDLYQAIIKNKNKSIEMIDFYQKIKQSFQKIDLDLDLLERKNNVNFSGGQKKKNELIQIDLIQPSVVLLDEIDSGCDFDAIKTIAKYINQIKKDKIIFLITHHEQLINLIKPNRFVLINDKSIVHEGKGQDAIAFIKKGFKQFLENK